MTSLQSTFLIKFSRYRKMSQKVFTEKKPLAFLLCLKSNIIYAIELFIIINNYAEMLIAYIKRCIFTKHVGIYKH